MNLHDTNHQEAPRTVTARDHRRARPWSVAEQAVGGADSWGAVTLTPQTLASRAARLSTWNAVLSFHGDLAHDDYVRYTDRYYRECVRQYGEDWRFWDIVNVLYASSDLVQPRNYLEIGVRRGRSACMVARACPDVDIVACDMWVAGYANMDNPGPEFVRSELKRHGHTGRLDFVEGNSHVTVPEYFRTRPQTTFDLITVDGDHSESGAEEDLMAVLPHLSVGGVVVFDDISHPAHTYLRWVWKRAISRFPELASFEWGEAGYGVAFAIRRA